MNLVSVLWSTLLVLPTLAQYVPEPYGWACYRMASRRNWPECKLSNQAAQKRCLCGLPDFVALTETCLQDAVAASADPEAAAKLTRAVSLCKPLVGNEFNSSRMSLQDAHHNSSLQLGSSKTPVRLPDDPTEQVPLNPVSREEIILGVSTAKWRMANDHRSECAGAILLAFWGGVILLRYLYDIFVRWAPERAVRSIMCCKFMRLLRSRVTNSPLLASKSDKAWVQSLMMQALSRSDTLILILFAALNYGLMFVQFPYAEQNFIYTTASQQWHKSLAIRCAFMIMWKLPLLFCFSSRNNIFVLLGHPWSSNTFNTYHRWIARLTIVDVLIHGVAISLVKAEQGLYRYVWGVEYWQWGVVGIAAAGVIMFQSMRWVASLHYELFKVVHVLMVVAFVVAAWRHTSVLPYGKYHSYAVVAIWVFDLVARMVRLGLAGRVEGELKHVDGSVSVITVREPPAVYRMRGCPKPAFAFLHLPPWRLFFQSHPFSLFRNIEKGWDEDNFSLERKDLKGGDDSYDSTILSRATHSSKMECVFSSGRIDQRAPNGLNLSDELVIVFKHERGITRELGKYPEGPISLAMDGPYETHAPLARFRQVICIAGGIGITAHLSHIQSLLRQCHRKTERIKLYWAIADVEQMHWAAELLDALAGWVDVEIFTGAGGAMSVVAPPPGAFRVTRSRLSCDSIIRQEVSEINSSIGAELQSTAILACGPHKLNLDARSAACWAIDHSQAFVDYFEESFSW